MKEILILLINHFYINCIMCSVIRFSLLSKKVSTFISTNFAIFFKFLLHNYITPKIEQKSAKNKFEKNTPSGIFGCRRNQIRVRDLYLEGVPWVQLNPRPPL